MIIQAQKISKKSFLKLLFVAFSLGFFFFFLLCGIAAVFGAQTVTYEGAPVTGIKGLIATLFMWPIFSIVFTGFMWLIGVLGLWVYSFFSPIEIQFKGTTKELETNA